MTSRHMLRTLNLSLEDDIQNGKAFAEHEHEFYVQFEDFDHLVNAVSMDLQEQWNIKIDKNAGNDCKGSLRIRRIQQGDVKDGADQKSSKPVQYVLTTKGDISQGSRIEVPTPTTEDGFDLFAHLSDSGMIKHRYHFPVGTEGLIFEVDVFFDKKTGKYAEWGKIDLEVKDKENDVPPFPFSFKKVIKGDSKDESEQKKIRSLYDEFFITKNKFVTKARNDKSLKHATGSVDLSELGEENPDDRDPGDHEFRGNYQSPNTMQRDYPSLVGALPETSAEELAMEGLTAEQRKKIPDSDFAYPKQRKLPLQNAAHVRNALSRFDQVKDVTDAEHHEAWKRIKAAAKKFDIEIHEAKK